ncbi:hypothetical protein [Komagataeibacter sp. FNDCR2]|uniref:hypothetical protein n=1 Tax=Komagataeibacter sp. FNDCR2 TaxID=2878682 RepID=UPI001E4ACEAE|nr:hypothetical protein [Komagataeibacter sp. FNDCR2]MCE2574443.1 hypothetical protein [Komagataeibacter sp. FNDCR2]
MSVDLTPICVNSSFRTSSTWLWTKFREIENFISYAEPFNEALSAPHQNVSRGDFSGWRSNHPPSASYYLEFMPLMQKTPGPIMSGQGISYDHFIPAGGFDGTLSEEEVTYLSTLVDYAHSLGRRPALMFTRSLGRARALKKAFPGKSIFLHRNLFHQWASYSGQAADGNNYFFNILEICIKSNRHDPVVEMLDLWFTPREPGPYDRNNFLIFLLFHLYIYTSAFTASDLIIDSTRIASDSTAREETEEKLNALLGHHISLKDARPSFEVSQLNIKCGKPEMDTVEQCLKLMLPENMDPLCRDFVHQAKNDAFEEWKKNDFYSTGMRSILTSKRAELDYVVHERNGMVNQCKNISHERDELFNRYENIAREKDEFSRKYETASRERDELLTRCEYVSREFSELTTRYNNIIHERNEALDAVRRERTARERLEQKIINITADHERMAGLLRALENEKAVHSSESAALSMECQDMAVNLKKK